MSGAHSSASSITFGPITAVPLIHGRLAFAIEVRRLLLEKRFDAIAVELPPSLEPAMDAAIEELPRVSVVTYRERPAFLDGDESQVWYVPLDPCDGIIEALRIARGERTPVWFVDAEVSDFEAHPLSLPDAHAIQGLGLPRWYDAVQPILAEHPVTEQDRLRESHMAARLAALSKDLGPDRSIMFLCGLAHWERIRAHLAAGTGSLSPNEGPDPTLIERDVVHPASLPHILGETPHLTWRWQQYRAGLAFSDYDQVLGLKELLLDARRRYEEGFPAALEKATPRALGTLLRFARKLCVRQGRLIPSAWVLTQAAKGCVGNDFAVSLLECLSTYPPNLLGDDEFEGTGGKDPLLMTETLVKTDTSPAHATSRTPGEARVWRRLDLRRRPDPVNLDVWKRNWNPWSTCSWPPEDVAIENFRDYISRRALGLAGLSLHRTEPFMASLKDGIDIRETVRDWHHRRIHVREEPRVAGQVGALVLIFEEDDDGTRFPYRTTWMAEHEEESTLAFYSTLPTEDIVGPGIGRIFYGGCLFLYPPMNIPDVWEDLKFERARRPSERLLLAALSWSVERFVAYAGPSPPAPEVKAQAQALDRHIIYIPLTSFAPTTLERLRRAHVLQGKGVRSWASRFIL